jgi:hypothetical protein
MILDKRENRVSNSSSIVDESNTRRVRACRIAKMRDTISLWSLRRSLNIGLSAKHEAARRQRLAKERDASPFHTFVHDRLGCRSTVGQYNDRQQQQRQRHKQQYTTAQGAEQCATRYGVHSKWQRRSTSRRCDASKEERQNGTTTQQHRTRQPQTADVIRRVKLGHATTPQNGRKALLQTCSFSSLLHRLHVVC